MDLPSRFIFKRYERFFLADVAIDAVIGSEAIEQAVVVIGHVAAAVAKELGANLGAELSGGIARFGVAEEFVGVQYWWLAGNAGLVARITAWFVAGACRLPEHWTCRWD
jgi:hypothetical protein